MEAIYAIILFVLGVGAAFLTYFAWHHTGIGPAPILNAPSQIGNGAQVS